MKTIFLAFILFQSYLLISQALCLSNQKITPYKFTEEEYEKGFKPYKIPHQERMTIEDPHSKDPIIYYFTEPQQSSFPIAIICSGSSNLENIYSIIHIHRHFLREFNDLGAAVLTVEQKGVDGEKINVKKFMAHYQKSSRLLDHQKVIEFIKLNPPKGWNGKLIFLGISEGCDVVGILSTIYGNQTIATMGWCGASDYSWYDELWSFIEEFKNEMPWHVKIRTMLPSWMPFSMKTNLPKNKEEYNKIIHEILKNPQSQKEFMGMTYQYHRDALKYPKINYHKIKRPFLVVAGEKDVAIQSMDKFVEKAKEAGAPITYFRVKNMDHYIRKRPDIIEKSFRWLDDKMNESK